MTDNNSVNQTLDRRRAEYAADQMMRDTTDRLATIVADGLLVWDRYLVFVLVPSGKWLE